MGRTVDIVRRWPIGLALAAVVACGPSQETQQQLATVNAQNDSLLQEVADQARFMSDVSAELAKVQVKGGELNVSTESPMEARRDSVRQRIKYITAKLDEGEKQLAQSRRRIRALNHVSDSLKNTLEQTISNYESMIADNRATIDQLNTRIAELESQNVALTQEREALSDTVTHLREENSTVYYVIGTKKDLMERGIITEEGGARTLFILWKRGEQLVPSRNLDPNQFVAIDKNQVTSIPLPEPTDRYRIASRQDLEALGVKTDEKGRLVESTGALTIAQPQAFWEPSRFLIIVKG